MTNFKIILLLCGIIFILDKPLRLSAQEKQNIGFENGNFNGWTGYQWRYSTEEPSINTSKAEVSIPTSHRHVIITDQSAYDSNTDNALKMIPDGYSNSARIGCEINNSDSNPRCWEQSLQHTMSVDSSNAFLLMKFACVLQYADDHTAKMEPRFKLTLYDDKGNEISDCSNYDVYSSGNMSSEFQTYTPSGANDPVKWRDWTTVGADLSDYIGKDITIEFMSADCTGRFHYGYAYFVVDYMPLYITVDYCTGDTYATLEAPDGFESYQWLSSDSTTVVGTSQNLEVQNPNEGETYYVVMESETGCEVSLSATIVRYEPQADFSTKMVDCQSNKVMFYNNSTTNNGTLNYLWDFGADSTSTTAKDSFVYQFETSGMHNVSLVVYNPPSGCTDTLIKEVESFSPPLVGFSGDTTYCPDEETELTAYGAYSYEWSTGDTLQTVSFGAPGGNYWMLGYSTPQEGCVSDTITFSISEEPDWDFYWVGDTVICSGDTDTLTAVGAVDYSWNTGDSSNSITLSSGGTYSVSGTNPRGCIKKLEINITEYQKPTFVFSVSPEKINTRNKTVDCQAESDEDLSYFWELGDGSNNVLQQFSHSYATDSLVFFPITVTATNTAGCFSEKSASVTVEPFVPNVFTPNNDGVNDIFMTGYNLTVFDRHGIILYSGEEGWDGYYRNKQADTDTYFYRLQYTDAYGDIHTKKGFITLVR